MIRLKRNAGLEIELDLASFDLSFGEGISAAEFQGSTLDEIRDVLLDKSIKGTDTLYYRYKDVAKDEDKELISANNLRYDITLIKGGFLGSEFVKTAGCYHSRNYPKLYEVLWGEVICLMQKRPDNSRHTLGDVILCRVKAKEKIIVLGGYGHVLINPSVELPAVIASWVSSECIFKHELYKEAQGAAYFITNDDGEFQFQPNKFFNRIKEIEVLRGVLPLEKFNLHFDKPIYDILRENTASLEFLNYPDKYNFRDCFKPDKRLFSAIAVS